MEGGHFIAGEWRSRSSGGFVESINPTNGEVIGTASTGSTELAVEAIASARTTFENSEWVSSPRTRAEALLTFASILESRAEEISALMSRENGKLLGQARHEVAAAIGEARYYAGLARNVFGRTFESGPGKMSMLTREPAGVVSIIVPWNAPVTLLVRSLAPALAAGCTTIVKPAIQTPLTNAAVIKCLEEVAGIPAGVVNSVNENGSEVGRTLSTHPDVDVVSFTGSSRTGKIVMANASGTVKRVSLELGGKAPALVFADADISNAIAHIRRSAIALNGQMCTSVSRVLVHSKVYGALAELLLEAFGSVRLGDPLDAATELGPLIDKASQERVVGIVERARDEADLLLKGSAPGGLLAAGAFISPSIFRTDDLSSWLIQDELFGPVISLEEFSCESEALSMANATRYGLASSVFTGDLDLAMRVARKLKFGTVWLNSHNNLMAEVETGGYRESGVGRLHGVEALNDFLETKHIYCDFGGA